MGGIFVILTLLSCNIYSIAAEENVDLIALVQHAKSDSNAALALDTFGRQFDEYTIDMTYDEKRIEIHNFELSLDVLHYIGSGTKKLQIANYCNNKEVDSSKLYRFINNYTSESLTLLHLDCIKDHVLAEFIMPFKEVNDLRCVMRVIQTESFLPMDQLFPKLQKLWVYLLPIDGERCTYIECNLSHLEHLALGNLDDQKEWIDSIEELIRKNAHIRTIEMKDRFGRKLMQFVNNHLADLESLSAEDLVCDEALTFNHVKHLTVRELRDPEKHSFPHLESFDVLFYEAHTSRRLNEFLKKHRSIRKLHLNFIWQQRNELQRMEKIVDELHNLDEVKIVFMTFLTKDVIKLVQKYKNWKKFELLTKYPSIDFEAIRNQFEDEYDISSLSMKSDSGAPWRGLLFVKKN